MQVTTATFSDPAMRAGLQQYYEKMKSDLYEALKAREGQDLPDTVQIRNKDGEAVTAQRIPVSAEQMVNALVSFDKWLDFQTRLGDDRVLGPEGLKHARDNIARLEANGPDSSSNVRTTFAGNGRLLGYVNADGTLAITGSEAGNLMLPIAEEADRLNLSGLARVNYLNTEIKAALARAYPDLEVTSYGANNAPTKREFAAMWYPDHDVDAHFDEAMAAARQHLDSILKWQQQRQSQMAEIGSFLLSLQEAS